MNGLREISRKIITLLIIVTIVIGSVCVPVSASIRDDIYIPGHAFRSGNYIYYAIGCDGGNNIYKYNITSQKSTLMTKGRLRDISVKGNYIYYTNNAGDGSGENEFYICRISKSGKNKKTLARGFSPVIVGNYVYYIKTTKSKYDTYNDSVVGLYRMNLNGSGKRKIFNNRKLNMIGNSKNRIYYRYYSANGGYSYSWRYYDIREKKTYATNIYDHTLNRTIGINSSGLLTNIKQKGYYYRYSGSYLFRRNGKKNIKIATLKGSIKMVLLTDDYLFCVSQDRGKAYTYILRRDGKGKKLVRSFMLAGGGWM